MSEEKKEKFRLWEERSRDNSESKREIIKLLLNTENRKELKDSVKEGVEKMGEDKIKYKEMDNSQNRREIHESFENQPNRAELRDKPKKDGNRNSN